MKNTTSKPNVATVYGPYQRVYNTLHNGNLLMRVLKDKIFTEYAPQDVNFNSRSSVKIGSEEFTKQLADPNHPQYRPRYFTDQEDNPDMRTRYHQRYNAIYQRPPH